MEKEFNFLIAIHFHQPVGNFDHVVERASARCYEPFLETISEFPDIKFNLHYSGCLLEWFKEHKPAILTKIKKLVGKGQLELLSGGFYEPTLPVLPFDDAVRQIQMLSEFINDEFAISASGAWLAERIWEPHIPKILSKAGIRYTIVDDTHLRYAGLRQKQLYGYYMTEEDGDSVSIFPSDKALRYGIPFHPQQESIDYFRRVRDEYGKDCVLYGDDGEKFGEWPGTNEWVYQKKWLYNFLKVLSENSSWLKTAKIPDYIKKHPAEGGVYLPTASYQEMSEWALPAEAAEEFEDILEELKKSGNFDRYIDFVRGGFWRNFLVKYPESNQMHKRMMLVSERLRKLTVDSSQLTEEGSMQDKLKEARKELFRSQCNCAYWHGVFGGLYLYHLRSAVYKHLISADRILDSVEHKNKSWIRIDERDFDCDGRDEFVVNTSQNTFIIDSESGAVAEWDIKDKAVNIVNTLSRRKEAYHRKLKQLVLEKKVATEQPATIHQVHIASPDIANKKLIYDNFSRLLFLDHFLPPDTTHQQCADNLYYEQGDFLKGYYHKIKAEKREKPHIEVEKEGYVNQQSVRLRKQFIFYPQKKALSVRYEITNLSLQQLSIDFAPEMNFSLTQDDTSKELSSVDSLSLCDKIENLKIDVRFSEKARKVFRFPVRTVSQSERDVEENYQASCLLPVFGLLLAKNKTKTISIDLEVS